MTATRRSEKFVATKYQIRLNVELENISEAETFIGRTQLVPQIKKWLKEDDQKKKSNSS